LTFSKVTVSLTPHLHQPGTPVDTFHLAPTLQPVWHV